jgi:IS66 Orf2 like protein
MIPVPTDARVWLVTGCTDMRKGYASLSLIVQETLRRNPNGGHLLGSSQNLPGILRLGVLPNPVATKAI